MHAWESEALRRKTPLEILERSGAMIRGSHLVYTSGKHGDTYINKDAVYPCTRDISILCS